MNKKILTAILLFVVLLFASVSCYANTNLGTEMQDSANKSQTTLQNAGNGIQNIASDVGNGVQGAAQSIGNGIQDMFNGNDGTVTDSENEAVGIGTDNNNNENTGMGATGTTGDYGATRTATDRITGTTMTNTAWVWLILGVVGVAIVALTWYYVSQHNDRH